MRRLLFTLGILALLFIDCKGVTYQKEDLEILRKFWSYAEKNKLAELSVKERIPLIGRFFLGSPYKVNPLNVTKEELPVINLRELDCVTLVEYTMALALLDRYDDGVFDQFVDNVVKLRYRDGEIVDYTSRLHYSTDWFYEMQKRHYLTDITPDAGGIIYPQDVCFMSTNYVRYPVLDADRKLIPKIRAVETAINKRTYYYIPKNKVGQTAAKIEEGDVILITTSIKGLDTSHLGIALKMGDEVYMLHASSARRNVVITKVPLSDYMKGIRSQTGIMIGRAVK